jgi:hypothetical protein
MSKPKRAIRVCLDSGAFSAFKIGAEIKLDTYCRFLHENLDWLEAYICLDVIDQNDRARGARLSYDNFVVMREYGLDPMPVWHSGEDVSWLYKYLDAGCKYIGIATNHPHREPYTTTWYEYVWRHLTAKDGLPIVKAHALGEGRFSSLKQFPWYSADSTSWLIRSQMNGSFWIPGSENPMTFAERLRHGGLADVGELDELDKAVFDDLLKKCGLNWRGFERRKSDRHSFVTRTYLSVLYHVEMERLHRALLPIRFSSGGLFSKPAQQAKGLALDDFHFYLVAGTNNSAWATAIRSGAKNFLISYACLAKTGGADFLRQLVGQPEQAIKEYPGIAQYLPILDEVLHDHQKQEEVGTSTITIKSRKGFTRTGGLRQKNRARAGAET